MENFDHEIKQTMNSLDGIRPIESNPFLITRIEARLLQNPQPATHLGWNLVISVAFVALLVAVNIMTVTTIFTKKDSQSNSQAISFFSEQVSDYLY
jgi:hypothetical protein